MRQDLQIELQLQYYDIAVLAKRAMLITRVFQIFARLPDISFSAVSTLTKQVAIHPVTSIPLLHFESGIGSRDWG